MPPIISLVYALNLKTPPSSPLVGMPTFPSRPFRYSSAATAHTLPARYRRALKTHPFLLFGLPFLATVVGASFALTPATAIRYERHDRKQRMLSEEESLGLGRDRRRVDAKEEYYRLAAKVRRGDETRQDVCGLTAAQDLDDWENRRVPRLKGEHDGILE